MSEAALWAEIGKLKAQLAELATREGIATVKPWTPLSGGVVYVDASGTGALTTEAAFIYDDVNNELVVGRARLTEQATPSTPVNPFAILFANATGTLSGVDDAGVVRQMVRHVENTTFTPAFTGSGTAGTFTYSAQRGHYTRLENLCFFRIYLEVSAVSVAPTGDLNITGLPFTNATGANGGLSGVSVGYVNSFNLTANCVQLTAYVEANATLIRLMEVFDNAATTRFPAASFQPSGIILSGFYQIA